MRSNTNRWLRSHAVACVSAALLMALAGCGGGSGGSADASPPPADPSALKTAAEGEVLAYFKSRIQERAAQGMDGRRDTVSVPMIVASADNAITGTTVAGTLLQEQGV